MKRLILMGGRPWLGEDKGKAFAEALTSGQTTKIKIAFCIFAQPESDWEVTRRANINIISKFTKNKDLEFKTLTPENFREVSSWADVVYLPGGNPHVLKEKLDLCGDIALLWDKKVIAGSSAGADMLCQHFMFLQEETISNGYGWVKVSCIPHWRSQADEYKTKDFYKIESKLLEEFPDVPVLCIPESEFVEFSVK
jgi:peptidase E